MRPIGTLPDAKAVAVFGDFLVANRIASQMDNETDGSFTVWIRDDDQVSAGSAFLAEYLASPTADKFRNAAQGAESVRRAEAEDLETYRRRIRTADGLFPKKGGYGVGILSYLLIAVCVGVALYTMLGSNRAAVEWMFIDDPRATSFLAKVRQGEVWRLITPIFLHFGPLHLVFNMYWIYQLGCMIEARRGVGTLAMLVILVGLGSNLAQYAVTDRANFGGMSGVVYGLIGYVWMRGIYDRASGVFLDQRSLVISLVWLVACFTGMLGPVANWAHLSGLILGMAFGRLTAWRSGRIPK